MSDAKHTPGPWREHASETEYGPYIVGADFPGRGIIARVNFHRSPSVDLPYDGPVNARLITAAPAYQMAWSLVPDEVKQRIFDALHKPDTEWIETAIARAEGR